MPTVTGLSKGLPVRAVVKRRLSVITQSCLTQTLRNFGFVCAVEYRGHYLPAQLLCGDTQMDFKHLTDVHSGRNAQRVKHYIKRCAVRKEGHILGRKYTGNDTLVTMTACHFIADGDLTLLGDIDSDDFDDAGLENVAVLAAEHAGLDNYARFAVRQSEGGVPDLARLLAEDRTEKSFFGW